METASTNHGTDITDLKSRTSTIESSLGSSRTDTQLTTFITNHVNVKTDAELTTFINNHGLSLHETHTGKKAVEFKIKEIFDIVHPFRKEIVDVEFFNNNKGLFFEDAKQLMFRDAGGAVRSLLYLVDNVQRLDMIANNFSNLLFGQGIDINNVLNFEREVSFGRGLSLHESTGIRGYFKAVEFKLVQKNISGVNTDVVECEFFNTFKGLFFEDTQKLMFKDNSGAVKTLDNVINTTIDARLTTVTTSATNETISSLINASLSSSGLLNTDYRLSILSTDIFEIMGEFVGNSVTDAYHNSPVRGYFANEYHPSNPTWGLFIFGLIDRPVGTFGAALKMAAKYFDIADPTIPFKENYHHSRWSTEFKFPTEWIFGPDRKDADFVVKSWKSAGGTKKFGPNPNNMNAHQEITSGHLAPNVASSNLEGGWGVINVSTSTTGLNNVYTSLEQFNTLDDQINNTTTGVLGKVSTLETSINNTYNKSVSDSRYPSKDQFNILNNTVSTNTSNISSIDTRVGSNESKLNSAETNITNINTAIGDDNTSGTIKGRIKVNEDSITTIQNDGFLQTPNDNSGKSLKCDNVNVLRGTTYLPVLTSDDFRQLLINNVDVVSGQVQQNTVLIAGPNLVIPRSPNPIVFVDSDGRLGSSSLSESRYDDQVFGVDGRGEDGNETDNNLQKFQHGLVPSFVSTVSGGKKGGTVRVGSSIHVLTASGTWRKLSDIFVENGVSTVSVSENLPDFQPITKNNQFALCSQVNGGTIFYADVDTSFISEHASRLYHTPERVNTLINTKIGDGSIANAVINHIESQTLTAVSDRRLKTNIKKINKNIEKLEPVEFEYKNDKGKTRYGLIAQDVKTNYPELVETDVDGKMSIKYLDIIGMLIKDNQDLRKKINEIEKFLKIK